MLLFADIPFDFFPASPVDQHVSVNVNHPAEAGSQSQLSEDRWWKRERVR